VILVCTAIFPLTMSYYVRSGDIRDYVAKLSEIGPKFWWFWAAILGGCPSAPNFWPTF